MKSFLIASGILLFHSLAFAQHAPKLKDITIAPSGDKATITFLTSGNVATVVLEPKARGWGEIRMKSMAAEKPALASAKIVSPIRNVLAHIERKDVLVADVSFGREVLAMNVTKRDSGTVEITVKLGKPLPVIKDDTPPPSKETGAAATKRSSAGTKSSDTKQSTVKKKSSGLTPPSDEKKKSNVRSSAGDNKSAGAKPSDAQRKWSLATIVIDAGHGGKDPGAIGIGDVEEKDITLSVARNLRDEIKSAMPQVNVVMTRNDDSFVELDRRGQIANERNGRLFISIHCNSMPEKPDPASGFECYILRPGKSDDAARLTSAENSAVKFEGEGKYSGTENVIVAGLAQNAFNRYSESLADNIRRSLRGHVGIPDRGVHQAGFYVLVGASMPAVLVEIGYISNEEDVKVLSSAKGQKKIAHAIFQGIRSYEKVYSASLRRRR
ncbi:MAG: N-acetylmuramoyl-L-alanine amidase [Bacteroidota bacterium]